MTLLQRLSGLGGGLVVLGMIAIGGWALATNYALEASGDLRPPTVATLAVTVGIVLALVGLGVRSKRRLENPYW